MYEVGINADPNTFLDWDRPLSEQPEPVRMAFGLDDAAPDVTGGKYYNTGAWLRGPFDPTQTDEAARASYLYSQGVPGIRYLDAGSRGAAEVNDLRGTRSMWETALRRSPDDAYARSMFEEADAALRQAEAGLSSNYVVFNDELVKILRKYGIGGLSTTVGASALAEELDRRGQTQEF